MVKSRLTILSIAICTSLSPAMAEQAVNYDGLQPTTGSTQVVEQQNTIQSPSNVGNGIPADYQAQMQAQYNNSGQNVQGNSNANYQQQSYQATANAAPQQEIPRSALPENYGVPQENVVHIRGNTIRYRHGKNADPEQVIALEKRTLDEKLLNATPRQIQSAQQRAYDLSYALNAKPNAGRCAPTRTIRISTAPDNVLPKLRTNPNHTTTIIFSDATGHEWLVSSTAYADSDITVSNSAGASAGNKSSNNKMVSNIIVNPVRPESQGSFDVFLKNNQVPIKFEYYGNEKVVDCIVHARVEGISPDNTAGNIGSGNAVLSSDDELLSVAMGTEPEGAKRMTTNDNSVRAWRMKDGGMIIRTRYKIVAPPPLSGTTTADGTFVYRTRNETVFQYRYNDQYGMFTVTR